MNPLRACAITAAIALTSCAVWYEIPPPEPPPAPQSRAPQSPRTNAPSQTTYKKPVRMYGRGEISSVSLTELFELQQSDAAMIFDARPAFFYNLGHIPGAINLGKHNCDAAIAAREAEIKAALASGKTLVVYCSSFTCPDARTVAIHLSGFGFPVNVFSGGWDAWRDADLPSE